MAKDLSWDELSTTNPTELSWDSLSVEPPKPKSRTWGDVAGDIGVTALKGAIGLPQALVGLADIPTGGIVGKTLEGVGYRPNEASKQLDDLYSDPQKAANRKVAEAEGFTGTLAAHLQNPSTIATTVGESVPQMLGGAGVARGLMKAFPKVAAWAAGALGEGIMGAGSAEEQTRAESADGLTTAKQGMAALASGAGTAVFGMAGGRLAGSKLGQKLGLADVDTMLASGKFTPSTAGFFKAVAGSGISEGVLEEMPQSAWEQMLQNYAQEKPLTEGMGKAMASGLVAGAAMGGAGGGFNAAMAPKPEAPPPVVPPVVPPVAPPADQLQLGFNPLAGSPLVFPDGSVTLNSEQELSKRFAPQKATIADIGAAPNMDDAIAAFTQVVSAPVDLAPDISDAQEFADLVQSEARNQQVMLAQMDQERIKQAQLDQIPAIAAEQNVTQEALQRAAALDAPTAMGSAFSKLFDKTIGAEPEARETAPAPVPAPKPVPEPRIVARDPGMLAMPRELAELRATMNGGELVRVQNQNGKFAYTVLEDGSKPSLARVANAAPPASVVDQRLTPVSKRTESTNEKAPEAIQSSAQRPQAPAATGPSKSAASAGVAATDETGGAPSPVEVSRYTGKFGKGMGKDAARLEAQRLNRAADGITYAAEEHNDPKLENPYAVVGRKDFAQPENKPKQAGSPAERAQAVTETVAPKKAKKPKGGQTLRAAAYDKNPLMTFLATHGLFHDKAQPNSHKSEFSPDKGIMVMGYGPVFKKTGKRLDVLTQNAIEEGYLPKDGTEAQLRELVRRAVAGEKISPLYAEGVAEQLAEQTFSEHLAQQQEAAQDADFDPFEPLSDLEYSLEDAANAGYDEASDPIKLEVNALLALAEDQGIDVDAIKEKAANDTYNDSEQAYYEAAKSALQAAIEGSNGDSREDAGRQGAAPEGLTAPTREEVVAQQDRAESATKAEAKAATDAANKAKADAERNEFTLTGSDRAADVGAAGGQQDIFAEPAAQATAILDAANVTGKERIDVLKDVKKGDITPDELQAAYPAKEPAAKIEDAGAKIGGARKDKWKDRGLDLTDLDGMSESEGAELATKANVWKPDYEAMAEATEPVTAAMVKTVYDQLAAQPKKNTPEGRRNYVTMMQAVRKAYSEAKSPEDVKQAGDKVKRAIGLYTDDAEAKKLAREVLFSVYKGRSDPFVLGYNELSKAKKLVEDGFPAKGEPWKKRLSIRDYGGNGITSRGIELTLKESAELGTPLTTDQIVSGFFRISNKDGKAVGYAPTKADAEATAKTIYERDLKKGPADKAEPTRPNLDALKREGLPTRTDRDVSANDFVKDFGFRGVEFGNWAAQDERQRIINMAYDGLKDLAEIMGLPPKALSLNGTMGMAFGARGGGKFSAHYEPGKLVINMTKINGGGSMAHEWAHALDHYFGELNQKDAYTTKARGASGWYDEQQYKGLPRTRMEKDAEGKWANVTKMRLDNMRPEMAKAFDDVMSALFSGQETKAQMVRSEELAIERYQALADKETDPEMKAVYLRGIESRKQSLEELRKDPEDKTYPKGRSGYASEAQKLVGKSATGYWTRPTEMFARAFESWVFDKVAAMGAKSDYLVHGVEEDRFAGGDYKGNPYPTGPERANINAAFDKLASTIQTKETDKGVAMFARGDDALRTGLTPDQFTAELAKAFGSKVAEQLQAKGVVVPLADQSKLPAHVVPFLRDGDIIYGFYDPKTDRTYAVLENLTSEMVKGLTLHEVGVHYGFKSMLGDAKYANVMQRLDVMRRAGSKTVKEAYAQAKANAVRDSQVAEETLAYLVQTAPEMSLVKEIIARIKAFLYTEFGIGGKYLNEADLTMLARAAVDHASRLEDGGSAVPAFMRDIKEPVTNPNDVVGNQGGRSADDTTPGGQTELVRNTDEFVSPIFSPEQVAKALDENRWLDRGLKLGRGQKIYRGVSEKTGRNTANFGRGLYTTTDMSEARQYGRVTEMVATDLPQNPLRFSDEGKFREWESYVGRELLGFRRIADFDAKHGTPDRWIPALDTSIDGIQIGTGPGAFFVKFPNESTAPDSGGAMFSRAGIVGQTNRQHTPEQLRAMKNVGFDVEAPTLKERAQALYKDAGKKLAQGIVDQFAPVKDLDKNAYGLLRLAKGASGAFEAFLQGGKLKLTDGVYDFDDANKGGVIDKLLIPLQGEHHDFMRWVAANRAERLQGEGKENLFSAQDIADLKTLASGTADFDYTVQTGPAKGRVTRDRTLIYADANRVFNEFNKNVLDMAEQSGLIDGASRKVWEHEFYVPFYRVADEDGGGVRGMSVKGSVLRQQAFKELKGGKNALNADLLDNTLMNWAHLLDASAKNRAAKATIEAAERMGVATGGDQATLAQMGASIHNKHGVVWFMDGGQKRYSLIDKEGDGPYLMTAINALEYAGMRNPVMNAMGAMKHALTVGVTASPFFKIRNLIRDSVQAIGTGNLSYNPAKNITEGWKLTDPKSDAYFRLLAGGGTIHFGTMLEGSEAKRVQALVESGVDDATILGDDRKVKAFYRKYIEPGITAYSELGNRGEAINRASLYDQLRKQGVNHADASLQARDLMDFSMQGSFTSIRFLTQVVPFLNARLQGLYKLGRAAKEDPARFSMVLGSVAAISLGLLAAYSDDDDWKKREDWDRNNFWWFKVGGTAFRIPKPFEIGAIATLAERGFELAFDKEMTNKRFMGQVMTLLGDNLSMNPVPQLVKPMLDVYANKDSFSGRPIETMGMEKLKSEYRFTDRTSMAARAASTSLNAVTGLVGKEALSPVQIDSMLRGYFGWLGSFIVGAGDKIARPATDQKDQASPDYWKVATGSIVSDLGDAPSRYVSAMYDQAKTLEEAYGTYRMLVKEGKTEEAKEFMVDHRDELTRYKRVEAVKRTEAKFNERIRMIERSALSSDAKRDAIRKVKEQKDRVARQLTPA